MFYMKKMKYFGAKVETQRIKAKRPPQIELIEETPENPPSSESSEAADSSPQFVEFQVISEAGIQAQKKKGKSK